MTSSAVSLMATLEAAGVTVLMRDGRLKAAPRAAITPEVANIIRSNKDALIQLLDPARDPDQGTACPAEWLTLPVLPQKATRLDPVAMTRVYRVRLFGRHWRVFWRKPGHPAVRATRDDGLKWEAPSLEALYRIAWIEAARERVTSESTAEQLAEHIPDARPARNTNRSSDTQSDRSTQKVTS